MVAAGLIAIANLEKPQLSTRFQREYGDLWRAVEAEGDAYGADASVDVELEVFEAEEAFDVLVAHFGQDDGAVEGQAHLAAVGVAGEHEVDEVSAGVVDDLVGVVGGVGHEEDGAVGVGGDCRVEVGCAGGGVGDAGEP